MSFCQLFIINAKHFVITRVEREQAELKAKQEAGAKERTEKIAKMSNIKTTEQIQAEIKAKHNL